MSKKLVMIGFVMILIGLGGFVSAKMTVMNERDNIKQYNVEISVVKGWNLIASGFTFASDLRYLDETGDIKKDNVKAVYVYSNRMNEYFLSYPKYDSRLYSAKDYFNGDEQDIIGQANWIYVDKAGTLKYQTKAIKALDSINLFSGWNFVSITPEMKGMPYKDFKGSCDILKMCAYQRDNWDCSIGSEMNPNDWMADHDQDLGWGFIIKVSNNCKLGGSLVNPPAIPD